MAGTGRVFTIRKENTLKDHRRQNDSCHNTRDSSCMCDMWATTMWRQRVCVEEENFWTLCVFVPLSHNTHTQTNFNVQRWNLSGIFSILLSFEYFILISAQHANSQQHSHEVISQAKTFLSKIRTKQKKNALKTTLIQFRLLSIWLAHPAPCRHHHHRFLASKRNSRFAARHIEGIDSGHMYSNFSTNIIFGIFKMESLCRLFIVRLRHRVSFK